MSIYCLDGTDDIISADDYMAPQRQNSRYFTPMKNTDSVPKPRSENTYQEPSPSVPVYLDINEDPSGEMIF